MNASTKKPNERELEALFSNYIAFVNRAMSENRDKFWFRQAKRLNKALWGGANFRTVIYEGEPDNILGTFTIHFDPDRRDLSVLPPGDHHVAFTWHVPLAYLRDVVEERPDWYLEHPLMLDWTWVKERVRDEAIHRVDSRSLAAGFLMGAAAAALAFSALAKGRAGHTSWR